MPQVLTKRRQILAHAMEDFWCCKLTRCKQVKKMPTFMPRSQSRVVISETANDSTKKAKLATPQPKLVSPAPKLSVHLIDVQSDDMQLHRPVQVCMGKQVNCLLLLILELYLCSPCSLGPNNAAAVSFCTAAAHVADEDAGQALNPC